MAIVTWQDLCFDALDVDAQSRFWAAVTGLEVVGPVDHRRLEGPTPRHTIWINEVDRPHLVKNRLHPDIYTASIADLVALGARVTAPAADTGFGWTVMVDPEGNEFCAFLRSGDALPDYRLHGIGIDCADAESVARWWGERFAIAPVHDERFQVWTITGAGPDDTLTLDFASVPEARTAPHRVHWDVQGDLAEIEAAGATRLWEQPGWTVCADPEGNEFCVFPVR